MTMTIEFSKIAVTITFAFVIESKTLYVEIIWYLLICALILHFVIAEDLFGYLCRLGSQR